MARNASFAASPSGNPGTRAAFRPAERLGDDASCLRHRLIRDAAYDGLPKATSAELHERFADWLEEHAENVIDELLTRGERDAVVADLAALGDELGFAKAHQARTSSAARARAAGCVRT